METPEGPKPETKDSDGIQSEDRYYYRERTRTWLREKSDASSRTDWIVGLFTALLTVVAFLQYCLLGRQAQIMSADERARLIVRIEQFDKSGKNQLRSVHMWQSPFR